MKLLLLAAALLIATPRPTGRLDRHGPRIPRAGPTPDVDPLSLAADIDLFATCIRAGLSTAAAATAVAGVAADRATVHRWRHVAALLAIGVPADRAWAEVADVPGLSDLAGLARMSGRSGAAMADACAEIATGLRARAADDATARAERAGVLIALPLATCFLPAFFLLGLAPVVISLGTQLLT